ncbi:hypothetical protein GCM10023185_03820 [Hymenobacter saemangeumensis]|uniref:T9SS type A sorting domain-containing protein n=1 Tax=Hymenobacter saemangeumensis TaxID=1084522 RepID=A0ABP8HZC7_9BACT
MIVSFYARLRQAAPLLALVAALSTAFTARAQPAAPDLHCLLLPLDPALRVQQAGLILEAEVRDAQSFWDAGHRRLYTRHRLRVFSLLKGSVADTAGLVLITEGGRLGLTQQTLTNTLHLEPGQQGVFFLSPAPWPGLPAESGRLWTPFGSEQGFIGYSLADNTAREPFRTYPSIGAAFYQELAQLTGQPRRVLQPNPALRAAQALLQAPQGSLRTKAPSISDLQPAQLPAGVDAVLTIVGNDFGASRGSGFVEFKNADDGGATWVKARESDYVSWTPTRVQVRVPSAGEGRKPAGSGRVRLTTGGQLQTESPGTISIIYALTNVESTEGNLLARPNHVASNDSGGISFRFSANFRAQPAPGAAWRRALNTWRCQTGMNWRVGSSIASNAIADDGQNVVAFDNASDALPAQVLGRTTSYYSGCYDANRQVVFYVKEIDMQFDDAANFQFGPALAIGALRQIDFETVALHELGHAQQLSHLIQLGAVMHYAVQPGRNTRSLDPASDIAGGRRVLRERSFRQLGCGGAAMLPAPLIRFSARFAGGTGIVLSWATRDECFLSGFAVQRTNGVDTTAWQTVATPGAGQGSGQYQYVDQQLREGLHFYRLRLQRPDGSFDYTEATPVTSEGESPDFAIFPNPVQGERLYLQYPAPASGAVLFLMYDALGRLQRRTQTSARQGLNVLSLNVTGLSPGMYVLRWRDEQGQGGSRKFVRL